MEPVEVRARLIGMRPLAPVLVLAGVLVGCGSADPPPFGAAQSRSSSTPTARASLCMEDGAPVGTKADLDGDGRTEDVEATRSGRCGPGEVSAQVDGHLVTAKLDDQVPVVRVFAVTLPGRTGQLVATRQDQPRGGFQVRVFAYGSGKLSELVRDGKPIVPFVATDTGSDPLAVDCDGTHLVVTSAVTHTPSGFLPAWDIRRTTYTIEGAAVTSATTAEIADNVLPKQLPRRYPSLVKHTLFADCG